MHTVLAYDLFDRPHLLIFAEHPWVVEAGSRSPSVRYWAVADGQLPAPEPEGQLCGDRGRADRRERRDVVDNGEAAMEPTCRLADVRRGRLASIRSRLQTQMLASRSGDGISPALIVFRPLRWRRPTNGPFFARAAACTRRHSHPRNDCERSSHRGIIVPDAPRQQVGERRWPTSVPIPAGRL